MKHYKTKSLEKQPRHMKLPKLNLFQSGYESSGNISHTPAILKGSSMLPSHKTSSTVKLPTET